MRDKKKYDIMTLWAPLIGAFIMFVAISIIYINLDNELYVETGLRMFEPGFAILLGILICVAMFFFLRSSGKKTAKKQMLKMTDQ